MGASVYPKRPPIRRAESDGCTEMVTPSRTAGTETEVLGDHSLCTLRALHSLSGLWHSFPLLFVWLVNCILRFQFGGRVRIGPPVAQFHKKSIDTCIPWQKLEALLQT